MFDHRTVIAPEHVDELHGQTVAEEETARLSFDRRSAAAKELVQCLRRPIAAKIAPAEGVFYAKTN